MIGRLLLVSSFLFLLASCKTGESTGAKEQGDTELTEAEFRAFQVAYFDGNKEKILGNYREAEILFRQALSIDPYSAAATFELAKLSLEKGRLGEAVAYAKRAKDLDPDNLWYTEFLAQSYAEMGRIDESIILVREILERQPEKYDYYFNLGSLLSAQGKFDEALKVYTELEERFGPLEEIYIQRQMIFLDQGDTEKALEAVGTLISMNPEEITYYGMKAEILERTGQTEAAKSLYLEMLNIDPENGMVLIALYEMSLKEGQEEQALNYLEQAFESSVLGIDVKVNILLNLLSRPNLEKDLLIRLSDSLIEAHPTDAKAYAIQGDIFYNLDDQEKARTQFRKAVEIDANRPPIWQQILIISSSLNDFEGMKADSEKALEYFPQQPIFYLFNGISLQQLGNNKGALEALSMGKNLVVDNNELLGQFYASIGDVNHSLENHVDSDAAYEKALKYQPNNVIVLNNYAYYLSLRGVNLERAETMAKKANDLSPNETSFQDTYAWVLFKRGNLQNALFWINEAIENGGDSDPEVLEHKGDILFELQKFKEAKEVWEKAITNGGDEDRLNEKIDSAP